MIWGPGGYPHFRKPTYSVKKEQNGLLWAVHQHVAGLTNFVPDRFGGVNQRAQDAGFWPTSATLRSCW